MFTVPNAKVLVVGGDLKKDIRITMEVIWWVKIDNKNITVNIDVVGTNGFHFDGALEIEIPPHMLTCKLDFLSVLKEMAGAEEEVADAVIEQALQECLRIVKFDITRKGTIAVYLGLNIRGDLQCETDFFANERDFYEAIFDFKK